jgi:hypothetical protein
VPGAQAFRCYLPRQSVVRPMLGQPALTAMLMAMITNLSNTIWLLRAGC